jgi:hypothetical protein
MKSETLANVAIVVTCILLSATAVERTGVLDGKTRRAHTAPAYRVGQPFPQIAGVDYTTAEKTVLLYISSSCSFCTASIPFWKRLKVDSGSGRRSVQFVAVGNEAVDKLATYLRVHDVRVDQAKSLTGQDLRIEGTPALIVVDRSGQVLGFWLGQLSTTAEADAMRVIMV